MPSGGTRKGSGRKRTPLAQKIAAGNPGNRPLKKVEWDGGGVPEPPAYLSMMTRREELIFEGIPTPLEIYARTVKHLEPSGCLNLISPDLLANYALAQYCLLNAHYELAQVGITGYKNLKDDDATMVTSTHTESMLKMQKNVVLAWTPIWEIVSRNSEVLIQDPHMDMIEQLSEKRKRVKSKGGQDDG